MKITARQYADALMASTDGKSGKVLESVVREFVASLAARQEMHRAREIMRAFDNAWRRKFGAGEVTLTTAYQPSKKLLDELATAYPHASIASKVKPELIGGAILQIDDRRFDGSVSGHLMKLHDQLVG